MQKRHFELFAQFFRARLDAIRATDYDVITRGEITDHLLLLADDLARAFAAANPRFDRARFLRACGLE